MAGCIKSLLEQLHLLHKKAQQIHEKGFEVLGLLTESREVMRWFFDTEFVDTGSDIKLISIGMINEAGATYEACLKDGWDYRDCDDWLRENVLPKLPSKRKSRVQVAHEIIQLIDASPRSTPEFWAYVGAYDWVALCQLVALTGRLLMLPHGWPHFYFDLKQLMHFHCIQKSELPKQDEACMHNALADARWVLAAFTQIRSAAALEE